MGDAGREQVPASSGARALSFVNPAILSAFKSASVLVVGDLILDAYWCGTSPPVASPGTSISRLAIVSEDARPGGAANVAANVASLGASAVLLGLTGEDQAADVLNSLLRKAGVSSRLIQVPGARTTTKVRVAAPGQPAMRLDFESDFLNWDRARLLAAFEESLSQVGAVIVSDYSKGALRDVETIIALARSAGKPIIVDPKGEDFMRYRGATVLSPNFAEFQAVVGRCDYESDIEARALELRQALGLQALLLTRGERGLSLFACDQPPLHLISEAREVCDETGAGDTVAATLGVALSAGYSFGESAALANVAAGIAVAKPGTATVSVPDLREFLRLEEAPAVKGICSEEQLVQLVVQSRRRGERLVMTNGCFDLLHPGHVHYLESARALGDRLIVAVNDDDSVRRLKGPQRPLNPLMTRMRMLSALSSVDWVVSFSDDTPERLYCRVLPDVLVKGGDYRPEDIAGARQVIAAGGQVRVLDFLQGFSTTALFKRIRELR